MKLPLKWIPGGKVEENENNEECIVRKLKKRLMLK
jgi:ADP-ribose pyrophosphatase YjhB (NUDIX family)